MTTQPTPPPAANATTPVKELDWLLSDFVGRVPGAFAALLVSRDGMKVAAAGTEAEQVDQTAAWLCGLYSLARGTGDMVGQPGARVRQQAIETDCALVFMVSADLGTPAEQGNGSRTVGSLLGVLAHPGCDAGVIVHEMNLLVKRVRDYLGTATRGSEHTRDDR